jgi:hypothetical protein
VAQNPTFHASAQIMAADQRGQRRAYTGVTTAPVADVSAWMRMKTDLIMTPTTVGWYPRQSTDTDGDMLGNAVTLMMIMTACPMHLNYRLSQSIIGGYRR